MNKNEYIVAGLMSGTSLDGLDVAVCRFYLEKNWSFEIIAAKTFEYSAELKKRLANAHLISGVELALLHTELGELHGTIVRDYLDELNVKVDFISSHGHTIFHQPEKRMTLQIGSAAHIAAISGCDVVADFRTTDLALGGQGAPLVPIGDMHLFAAYDLCLNLGGIANISMKQHDEMIAFDICPCNMVLNYLANQLGHEYDHNGDLSAQGEIDHELLAELNHFSFYHQLPPKSLGKEFFESEILRVLQNFNLPPRTALRTFVEHIAIQCARVVPPTDSHTMLLTGGGALNSFLVERIRSLCPVKIVVPDQQIIQFKEALIFAFLGVLRMRFETNCLASVTGAVRNNVGGAIYSSR